MMLENPETQKSVREDRALKDDILMGGDGPLSKGNVIDETNAMSTNTTANFTTPRNLDAGDIDTEL